ncbi:type I-E CRISPR-associated protein Cas7/Cse4/CasC [Pyramidobacter piscolens]|uniref:type I-E CRISPR-associated protein Cas7/Cse4/CasC n=1 Tax=Pyramidobacter piscolens TaxID=638849 RepID=UPI003AB62D8B
MLYEIHMLKNYPPANLNRDDTGMPKTCYFGGAQRGRISSQCLKRAWRTSPLFSQFLGQMGIRTRKLPELVAEELKKRGFGTDIADAVKKSVSGIANKEGKENKDLITSQIVFYAVKDIVAVADAVEAILKKNGMKGNNIKAKEILEQIKDADIRPITLDIALFGRMVTSPAFADVEAAVQTAHAISTHAVNSESDYFTAVDDLVSQADDLDPAVEGAGMIGEIDYNSCCYYHYIAIDTDVLKQNLANSPEAQNLMDKVLPAFIQIMAYTDPSGKQNSFASHVLPELLCVEVKEKKIPVSYANAYATPVPFLASGKLIENSVKALIEEIDRIDENYGLEVKHRFWFCPRIKDMQPRKCEIAQNMGELLIKCRQ